MNRLYLTFNGFEKAKRAWGIFYFLSEYARNLKRAINHACIQQLSIEIAEKTKADNAKFVPSGIYRNDNSWLYIQGNFKTFWIFSKKLLILLHCSRR